MIKISPREGNDTAPSLFLFDISADGFNIFVPK